MEKGMSSKNEFVEPPCVDCVILSGGMYLEYPDGKVADATTDVYNHHTTISAIGKSSKLMVCPGGRIPGMPAMPMSTVLGGAADDSKQLYSSEDGEFNSGFIMRKEDMYGLTYQLVNYKNQTQEIYAVAEFEYVSGVPAGFLDASTLNIVPTSCEKIEFKLDQKVKSFTSGDWEVPANGYILSTRM
jgi:hypothetical protein